MKKIIISSITLFFLFPTMSADAIGKRSKKSSSSQPPCPAAVAEGTAIESRCSTQTITCPRVALRNSKLDRRCSGVTTLCNRYDNTPPPACVYISQPERPAPVAPITPITIGDGPNISSELPNCYISRGAKRCSSCSYSSSGGSSINKGITTETHNSCSNCTTTIEPLVPKKACNNNSDCALVPGGIGRGSCGGKAAILKSQEGAYRTRLEKERKLEAKERERRRRLRLTNMLGGCLAYSGKPYAYCVSDAAYNGIDPAAGAPKFCRVGISRSPVGIPIPPSAPEESGSLQ